MNFLFRYFSLSNLIIGAIAFLLSILTFFVVLEVLEEEQRARELEEYQNQSALRRAETKRLRAKADEIMTAHMGSIGKYKIPFAELDVDSVLGQGAYGIVCKGRYLGEVVAIKMINDKLYDDEAAILAFKDEIELMCPLRHRNVRNLATCHMPFHNLSCTLHVTHLYHLDKTQVIFMYGACWHSDIDPKGNSEDDEMCLVVEFAAKGTLEGLIDSGSICWSADMAALDILLDAARGMRYLHDRAKPIVHRDLKPENILINGKMVAKISDFGASRVVGLEDALITCAGTPLFAAPEVSSSGVTYNECCDVWSFAMIMAQMVGGAVGLTFVRVCALMIMLLSVPSRHCPFFL